MASKRPISLLALALISSCADPGGQTFVVPGDVIGDSTTTDTADVEHDPGHDASEVAACAEGLACDDRDPCTVDDTCRDGVCVGNALSCEDGVSCTLDRCVGGACRHEVAPGFCRLEGVCFVDQQKNPNNGCEICDADNSRGSWTSREGLKCDDGDPCTTGDECGAGVCAGEPVTTGSCGPDPDPDPDPDPELTCSTHFDCYPDRVCVSMSGGARCARPCGSSAECGEDVCRKVPGSANVGACVAPVGAVAGSACVADTDCQSGVCFDGVCRDVCFSEAGCGTPGFTCRLERDRVLALCVPDAGALSLGTMCTDGVDIHSGFCASQHCDLVPYGTVGPQALLPCAPLCRREQDCAWGQECGVVQYAESTMAQTMPFHPQYQTPTRSAVTACYSRQGAVQNLGSGTVCTSPTQCASNKCLRLDPVDPNRYCSGYCATDADCPATMQCKTDTITLASDWFQTPWINAQPATTQTPTLVRVCKFR